MALYFECRINKNALLRLLFQRFCPLGSIKIFAIINSGYCLTPPFFYLFFFVSA